MLVTLKKVQKVPFAPFLVAENTTTEPDIYIR